MKKITYFYALLFAMLIGGGWTNYAWADIDWGKYASNPQANGSYYLCSYIKYSSEFYFFNTPSNLSSTYEYINATNPNGTNVTPSNPAILFTLGNSVTKSGNVYTINEISYQSGTRFLYPITKNTESWPKTTSACAWKMSPADASTAYFTNPDNDPVFQLFFSPTWGQKVDSLFYAKTATVSSKKVGQLAKRKSLDTPSRKGPWVLITPEAYEDATASNQYYYTVAAQAYTNGAASTDGGTVGVVPKTYQKPDVTDWAAGDYGESIAESKKGSNTSSATVTFYAKIGVSSESYNFAGFTDGDGNALTESETIAPNNYYEVDAVNHIYRVTIAVNGSEGSPTNFELRACFASASEPVVNVYNTNDEVNAYGTLAAALGAAESGYRVELLANIENVSSTITINKDITLDFNGHSISGSATNLVTVSGNVTFVDNYLLGTPGGVTTTGATAVLVTGGGLTINDGKYKASTYAVERTGGSVTIKNGGFESDATQDINGTITLNGGFFYNSGALDVTSDYAVSSDIPTGMKYTTADYRYMVVKKTSENYPLCVLISELENKPTIRLNFNSLEKAIAYANNNDKDGRTKTILLKEDYTLPAGNYTIPTQTTLVIPYSAEQTSAKPHIDRILGDAVPSEAYRTLTLANGVHIDVFGAIEVGGQQTGGTATSTSLARPGGDTYGLMQMNSGSSITLYENANFYAWGFVTGEGTMDMRRGAVVREQFQINDWKTLGPTCQMAAGSSINYQLHVLPINQYFIQNIEVKTTYRPGSRLLGQVCAFVVGYNLAFNDVGIIGVKYSAAEKAEDPTLEDDVAIFLMDNEDDSEDTWVRKSYDVAHDTQLYEVNNSAYLGSLKMYVDLKGTPVNLSTYGYGTQDHLNVDSKDFVLPLTNNFKIHLLYGNLYATQNTVLLPGAEIEVNKKSTLTINANQTLSLYDANQWGQYTVVGVTDGDLDFGYATRIKCRPGGVPTVRDISSAAGLGDAKLIVHGKVDVQGYLKTTTGDKKASCIKYKGSYQFSNDDVQSPLDGGAAVVSTIADAGTITFSTTAPSVSDGSNRGHYLWQVTGPMSTTDDVRYVGDHEIPALLTNEDSSSFTHTENTAAGTSFCFIDFNGDGKGEWKSLTTVGCFVKDENNVYYAKPQDYVALENGATPNNNHTYSAVDGRTLILVDDCQWWKVEPVENRPDLFHCTHPLNDMYYYWDGTKWTEKRYTVTWNDWNGDTITTYSLKYGVQPKYLGNIPTRDKDTYYTYDFIGWSPKITESTIVTGDITYTAQYTRTDRMYTVTWKDEGGNVIETGYFKMGGLPVCESAPDMTNKEWNPAVSAVTGNTTYTLRAKDNVGPYDIKFVNWNGEQIGETQSVAKDALPSTPADPTKPALADIEFEFAGWTPMVAAATADAVYTATFTEKPITYTITWKNDDGTTLGTSEVTPNTVPQYNGTPARSSDAENYIFDGWTPALETATRDASYTATYRDKNMIVDGETYNVPESTNEAKINLTIKDDGVMVIPASSSFNANTLVLESDGTHSGELIGAQKLFLTGDAIFRLEKPMAAATWYAVAVPWTVNINKGIYAGGKRLSVGEFFVIEFDANAYADADRETGTYWNFLDETGKDMQPGKLYMIWLKSAQSAIEFHKTSGNLLTTSTTLSPAAGSIPGQSHWNAIANPALFHANLATGAAGEDVLKYNGDDAYIVGSTTNMIVGEPMFVQTATSASVTATRYTGAGMPAYHRAPQTNADNRFVLELTKENQLADRLIVQTAEEKANEYVIGKDLSKMGVSSKVAQMWIERYDAQLCKNTIELLGEQAEYPLSLFAPAAGEYVLSASQERGESVLYLTRNGQPVWNLSYGECVLNVEEGTTNEYGLRIVSSKAPQTATGVGNVQSDGVQCTKELRDGVIYILRGEKVYTIDGQLVK